MLENPGIPLPFRIQTVSLKVLDLKFKVLDTIIIYIYIFSPSTTAQYKQQDRSRSGLRIAARIAAAAAVLMAATGKHLPSRHRQG
ncbi:hypothetical protein FOXYSP1_18860 [Fusarium oxysporum f. sp. phaseoli]